MAKILVIDQEPSIRLILRKILSYDGHIIHESTNCLEALSLVSSLSFDFIVFNVNHLLLQESDSFRFLVKSGRHKCIGLVSQEMNTEIVQIEGNRYLFDKVFYRPVNWSGLLHYIREIELSDTNTLHANILVVDDNESIHLDFRKILIQPNQQSSHIESLNEKIFTFKDEPQKGELERSYRILHAYNGSDGIELVKNQSKAGVPIDAIFMDIRMPGMDGVQASAKIRDLMPDANLVFCSAHSDYTLEEISSKIIGKPFHFLAKPFQKESIIEILDVIFSSKSLIA